MERPNVQRKGREELLAQLKHWQKAHQSFILSAPGNLQVLQHGPDSYPVAYDVRKDPDC